MALTPAQTDWVMARIAGANELSSRLHNFARLLTEVKDRADDADAPLTAAEITAKQTRINVALDGLKQYMTNLEANGAALWAKTKATQGV